MLKYTTTDIVFSEVPDEVSLAITISGCPNRCPGCHSPQLQQAIGTTLDNAALDKLIAPYENAVTCVCLMGGDAEPSQVVALAKHIKQSHPQLRTAWYSGRDLMPQGEEYLDYVKLGAYRASFGPLDSPTTNQRMLKRIADGRRKDITEFFQRKGPRARATATAGE
ncbi:MAG: anaerobic ribonucleoside-triphosphate reductase activating protein [Bacteroidales bacterium]|nr:anaerobic ribonucleoside-triphosphate reductase activating protein [Bacteroidales bacterium]